MTETTADGTAKTLGLVAWIAFGASAVLNLGAAAGDFDGPLWTAARVVFAVIFWVAFLGWCFLKIQRGRRQ